MPVGTTPTPDSTPEGYVKFRGMQAAAMTPDIALGDLMRFSGLAECVQLGTEKRADGEQRPVVGMRVVEVELGEITAAPKDEQLPFEDDDTTIGGDAR
ncbi:MAG: hypothetical protein EPO40_02920 [Myxococcaceae bacterium]|nr:MAG: hypothetical protein EPO40_02920 [Myxococcaceae bacterium]